MTYPDNRQPLPDPTTNYTATNFTTQKGNHAGGCTYGPGFTISWQRGPVYGLDGVPFQNGAFLETVAHAVLARLKYVNEGDFVCEENEEAIRHLEAATDWMKARRVRRDRQGKLGTHASEK